tara:strand:- start:410 stop:598 length:189 start_codon:yes stop_codon:yes gene_type:complete
LLRLRIAEEALQVTVRFRCLTIVKHLFHLQLFLLLLLSGMFIILTELILQTLGHAGQLHQAL